MIAVPGLRASSDGPLLRGDKAGGSVGTSGMSASRVAETLYSFFASSISLGLEIDRVRFFFRNSCDVVGRESLSVLGLGFKCGSFLAARELCGLFFSSHEHCV